MPKSKPDQLVQEAVRLLNGRQWREAEGTLREVLQLSPYHAPAMEMLAVIAQQTNRPGEALALLDQVNRLTPVDAKRQLLRGDVLQQLGQFAAAGQAYREATQLGPGLAAAWTHWGVALAIMGDLKEAEVRWRQAASLAPKDVLPLLHLARSTRLQGRLTETMRYVEQVLGMEPNNVQALGYRAGLLSHGGRAAEAVAVYRRATALAPHEARLHGELLMTLNYDPTLTPAELMAEHRQWAERFADPLTERARAHFNTREPERRLRVGYVSGDFKTHAVATFMEPVLGHHDAGQLEIFAYSNVERPDAVTERLRGLAGQWRDISRMGDDVAAELMRNDGIDILVELSGHTGSNRLGVVARKPAPVQMSYLGYPHALGMKAVGYRVTDAIADPLGETPLGEERVIRLPGTFCTYQQAVNLPVAPLPAATNGFVTFGSCHALVKLNDAVLDLWCRVLRAVGGAKLLIFRSALLPEAQEYLRGRLRERGMGDERIILEQRRPASGSHLSAYDAMDVHLDCFPWNGHTTTCDALWMGVPTVALRGERHAGRMSASVLAQVRLTGFIAESAEEYVAIAGRMAGDLSGLAALRAGLRERMEKSRLCDAAGFTRDLEAAYRGIWRTWCVAQPAS